MIPHCSGEPRRLGERPQAGSSLGHGDPNARTPVHHPSPSHGARSGNSVRLHDATWITSSMSCLDFELENTDVRSVIIERFTLDFDADVTLGLHEGAKVRQEQPDELTVIFPPDRESDPGDTISARACMAPLARPQRLEELVLTTIS
jgi:hypothetical protein